MKIIRFLLFISIFLVVVSATWAAVRLVPGERKHTSTWVEEHRFYAERQSSGCVNCDCKECHQQSFCSDCHYGGEINEDLHKSNFGADYKPRTHRTDFREIHPINALDDPRSCVRCHDQKRFCAECHSKFNPTDLRMISHRKGFSNLEVKQVGLKHSIFTAAQCQSCHPNSLLPKHQWSSSHAREARKNLLTCQSCHPQGNVCLKCHSARSGLMVNPHPRNWGKISGRMGRVSNDRTCVKCH